jgi:hypothetical protein
MAISIIDLLNYEILESGKFFKYLKIWEYSYLIIFQELNSIVGRQNVEEVTF